MRLPCPVMAQSRESLRDEVIGLLNASRELSPSDDHPLAETFVTRLEQQLPAQTHRSRPRHLLYAALSALVVLLAIPVVMVIQTYSHLDGYLPPLDAGALPLLYWVALMCAVILLLATLVSERTGWHVRVGVTKEDR
ncbi:MAG: hypothetical protein M3Z66_24225 [Chloroflexota bacterium]|nr:hypothetical protein [Chloroflexota bacterium]